MKKANLRPNYVKFPEVIFVCIGKAKKIIF